MSVTVRDVDDTTPAAAVAANVYVTPWVDRIVPSGIARTASCAFVERKIGPLLVALPVPRRIKWREGGALLEPGRARPMPGKSR